MRDARGRTLQLDQPPRRVVSLVPSLTETLFELGAGDSVVGVTDFCIFPSSIEVPRIGGTKNPDVEQIRALAPDLVHMNLEENLPRHAEAIERFAPVFATEPKRLDDVTQLFEMLGAIHDRRERAAQLVVALREEMAAMPAASFRFACPIWKDPWMWCGGDTYVSHLVEAAGGRNVLAGRPRYPQLGVEEVLVLEPDLIFLPDEPYLFTGDDAARFPVRTIGPFPGHLFTWHGSRTIEGLRFLREALPR